MNKLFRTYYKPDINTPDGALKFEQRVIDGELYFVYDDLYYKFQIPFLDEDWVVQQFTGKFDNLGAKIFEGDIISYKDMLYICEYDTNTQSYIGRSIRDDFKQNLYNFSDVRVVGDIMKNREIL